MRQLLVGTLNIYNLISTNDRAPTFIIAYFVFSGLSGYIFPDENLFQNELVVQWKVFPCDVENSKVKKPFKF